MPACENCRARKVACDHAQPVCRRCIDRGQETECVYSASVPRKRPFSKQPSSRDPGASAGGATPHSRLDVDASAPRTAGPAPSLRPGSAEGFRSLRREEFQRQTNTRIHDSPKVASSSDSLRVGSVYSIDSPLDRPGRSRRSINHELASTATTPGGHLPSDRASTPVDQVLGYMGFTSHSSVFEETKNSLSMLQGFHDWLPQPTSDRPRQGADDVPRYLVSPTREMCLVVLRGIPALNMSHFDVKDSPFYRHGWLRLTAGRVLADLHERFGAYLGPCRVDSQLEDIAHFLSDNSTKPFQEHEPDPQKWIGQFTGPNLRWESLGLIFAHGEPTFPDMNDPYSGFDVNSAKKEWAEVSRVCLGLCIDLSRRFASANSLLAQLSMRRTILESIHAGDASKWTPCILIHTLICDL